MADKHSLNYDVRELKLGASFTNNKTSQYHTIKYDFKPASVDVNKMASVDVGTNNQVTVTVPHLDGAGVPQTVFKGSQRPYTKECVLIIDRVTGEITLERLSSNIQVKKTRQETMQKPRPLTPVTTDFTNTTQRSTSRTRVATNKRTANAGPAHVPVNNQHRFNNNAQKNQNMVRSPPRVKTSPPQAPWSAGGNSTLASLPMIGFDDGPARSPQTSQSVPQIPSHAQNLPSHAANMRDHAPNPREHASNAREHVSNAREHVSNAREHASNAREHVSNAREHVSNVREHSSSMAAHASMPRHAPPPSVPPLNTAARQDDSSSSSSSDSDSGSGSDSDSDDNDSSAHNTMPNGTGVAAPSLPTDVLNDDLCLSESGSDSD